MNIDKFLNDHENKDLLRLLTCGSVDDGKSTLIGRLLYDSKLIFEDQLQSLHKDSERVGNAGAGEIDYALLLDGLKAEREQGITIDVAYRYFSTPKRKFIIADTPGHEQYTRNMATGASTADLAIILIDARRGVLTQTRRHSFIVSLLGIKHIVVAVNKMDLVDYDQKVFDDIREEFLSFTDRLNFPDVQFVPLSALRGDNVVDKSDAMPWYDGDPILKILEEVDVGSDRNFDDFRFSVQAVIRPDLDFRGFAGTVASGVIKVGDRIAALPSQKSSTIKRIVTADGDLDEAFAGQAVTLELSDEIDISSGEMIVKQNNLPQIGQSFEASLVWMSEQPLDLTKNYYLKHTSRHVKARVNALNYQVDVNTLKKSKSETLNLNEIGRATISTHQLLFFDPYAKNQETGSFILVDDLTNNTVASGMIVKKVNVDRNALNDSSRSALKEHIAKREIDWARGSVASTEREVRNGHKGKAVIVTGASGNGQHDLALKLERSLFNKQLQCYYMGLGSIIGGLDSDLRNDFVARDEHLRRLGELARIITDAGLIFISAIDNLDDYELEILKLLNSPYDLVVINLGESELVEHEADLAFTPNPDQDDAIGKIIDLLGKKAVILDYII